MLAELVLPAEQVLLAEAADQVALVVWLYAADHRWQTKTGWPVLAMAVTSHAAAEEVVLLEVPVQTVAAAQVVLPAVLPLMHSDSAVQTEIRLNVQPS